MHGTIPPLLQTSYGAVRNEADELPTYKMQLGTGFKPPTTFTPFDTLLF
jgi:hypothetical protein